MSREVSEALRGLVTERAYHVCEYCLVHDSDAYHGCEVDHIISVKHNGQTVLENLAYACFHCNRHKGTDLGSFSLRTGELVRFFQSAERLLEGAFLRESRAHRGPNGDRRGHEPDARIQSF